MKKSDLEHFVFRQKRLCSNARHARHFGAHPRLESIAILRKSWMAGTNPAMTVVDVVRFFVKK